MNLVKGQRFKLQQIGVNSKLKLEVENVFNNKLEIDICCFGVDENKFSVAGYADTRPKFDNNTPEGQAYNRRVDIIILDEGHF